MNEERAFAALTLLVAVAEQAITELERLEPAPRDLLEELTLIRDDASVVAHRLGRGLRHPTASS